jgi:hypothetical protein
MEMCPRKGRTDRRRRKQITKELDQPIPAPQYLPPVNIFQELERSSTRLFDIASISEVVMYLRCALQVTIKKTVQNRMVFRCQQWVSKLVIKIREV